MEMEEKVEGDRLGTKCACLRLRQRENVYAHVSQELNLWVGMQAETSLWTLS